MTHYPFSHTCTCAETNHLSDDFNEFTLHVANNLTWACCTLLQWMLLATGGFTPTISTDMRKDLLPAFSVLACLFSPTLPFHQHNR